MPQLVVAELSSVSDVDSPAHVHGAACAVFEGDVGDHRSQRKPFSVGPVRGGRWRLGWLAAEAAPVIPKRVRFGRRVTALSVVDVSSWTYAELAASRPVRSAELVVESPLYFSRNGRDLPLPDPVLIVRSAVDRWNHGAPSATCIGDDLSAALLSVVRLASMSGQTVRWGVGPGLYQSGFVGWVRLALPASAADDVAVLFAALVRFLEMAGVGARTTYGFGAVRLRVNGAGP